MKDTVMVATGKLLEVAWSMLDSRSGIEGQARSPARPLIVKSPDRPPKENEVEEWTTVQPRRSKRRKLAK